jgi:ASC-1-like (ASCH) protein
MARWNLKFASYKTKDDIFNAIVIGKKTIETRPRNPESKRDYSDIKVGDTLVFQSLDSGRKLERKVVFIRLYRGVVEMVEKEDPEKIFPGVGSKDNLLILYDEVKKKWGKSYAQKLEKYGIVAIGFE